MASSTDLTDRQRRVLRAMSHTYELAADIAQRAEVDNRAMGSVLRGLSERGLVQWKQGEYLNDRKWYRHPRTWRLKG